MKSPLSAIARFLRSRKLAVTLLALAIAYVFIGTIVPQGAPTDARVSEWARANSALERVIAPLGLHAAYSTPFFLALVALLAASTAVCSWERTSHALRLRRRMGPATSEQLERLRDRPQTAVMLSPDVDDDAALIQAATRLRRAGLRVRRVPDGVEAVSGAWTAFGSATFHWTLVALAIVLFAGQATRAEGAIDLPVGVAVPEVHSSYTGISEGPLFGERHTGVELVASDLVYNHAVDGINRGPAPVVTLLRGASAVASGRVYPNSPLRYGSLLVHMAAYGLAPVVALEDTGGTTQAAQKLFLEFSRETSSGTVAQEFEVSRGGSLRTVTLRVEMPVDRNAQGQLGSVPVTPRLLVQTGVPGGTLSAPVTVGLGAALPLPGGGAARFISVDNWVRVTVANDWSVPFVYGLGILACVALTVALLAPARGARFLLVETADGSVLHVASWHSRGDAAFAERVHSIAREAAGSSATETEGVS